MATNPFDSDDPRLFDVSTRAPGPKGSLPLTPQMLRERPSGDLFGWTQNAGMGWNPSALGGREFLMLSTHGGIRAPDGTPIALGYHTGHWEVGLLLEAAADVFKSAGAIPFAAACTDPCDGRSQGTTAMFDSLPFRNDAATVFRRLIRSLPTRRGVLGVATCDKGLPAMMMALAASHDLPAVLVPGGVTLLPEQGEDAGKVQTLGVRFAHGMVTLEEAADLGCRACGSPGGGCQFLGTAATSQVVGEALGMSLGHSALAPSGHPIWIDMARRSATALMTLESQHTTDSRCRDRCCAPQRDGRVCRIRRIDESHPARSGDRSCGGAAPAVGRGVGRGESAGAEACRRAAQWPAESSDRAGVHGRRRSRGDAASAPAGAARHERDDRLRRLARRAARRVGILRAPHPAKSAIAEGGGESGRRDCGAGTRARPRADLDGLFSSRQPRAGRFGDQEHRDRSVRGRRRWRVSIDRPREGVSLGAGSDGGDQKRIRFRRATCSC